MREELIDELISILGEDGFFALTEAYAGIRLYVPGNPNNSDLPGTLGLDYSIRLSKRYPGSYIRVPMARAFRAVRHRERGATNREIALRLGVREDSVEKLFRRGYQRDPEHFKKRSRKDPRQLDLL
jgi:hypothetical protein